MSFVAEAESTRASRGGRSVTISLPRLAAAPLIAAGTTVALVLAAAIATGGLQLKPTTDVIIGFLIAGGALAAAALLRRPGPPLYGGPTLLAFALLAALTALSVIWSLSPADSYFEAGRTLAYVAVFAAGIALVRLAPGAWGGLVLGIGLACLALSAWALLTKVFPATLAPNETYARLREPFAYWNSVGVMAAMGVPPMLWLAARRMGHGAVNALAWPALCLLLTCLMLAYSRGALVALVAGLVVWFALVPLRLRALYALSAAVLGTGVLVGWVFGQDGLTTDDAPMAARVDAGHEFGALLLLVCAVLLAAGLAAQFLAAQRPPSHRMRQITGGAALGVLALLPVVLLIALATADGGVSGQVSKGWHQLTDVNARTPANTPNRLTATSSVRARYWDEALRIHADSPWIGTGAGAYVVARTRYRKDALAVRQAHGYVVQTLSDLGWAGLVASLALTVAWLLAAARAIGLRRRDRGLAWDAERIGMVTLIGVVFVFAVHSAIDWTWFVPANAAAALLCAGWVAGRGPLRARLDQPAVAPEPAPAPAATRAPVWPAPGRLARWRSADRGPVLAAALVLVLALAASWAAFQPVRSVHAGEEAYDRLDAGEPAAAADIAGIAAKRDPLSVEPLFQLAAIEQARGRNPQAQQALERAVKVQPANAETWRRLGRLRLSVLGEPKGALRAFQTSLWLDPVSPVSASGVIEASRAAAAG